MAQKNDIRNDYFSKGKSISKISEETRHDRKTIRGIIKQNDWNVPQKSLAEKRKSFPKLEPFKKTIDEWLITDKKERKKQRHTAKRVYDRLKEEEETCKTFNCSYRTVAGYVAEKRKEIFNSGNNCFIPLEHSPSEAQADFGTAAYCENSTRIDNGKYLNLSFPYANQGFMQLFPGENTECLFEGLVNIFNYIGGVPPEIWFDNMSVAVKSILSGGDRELTERFERFKAHYGFQAIFCNPNAGNEKGNVENKVGYHSVILQIKRPPILHIVSDYF
jgi:transposase